MDIVNNDYNDVEDLAEMIASQIEEHIMDDWGWPLYDQLNVMDGVHQFAETTALRTQAMLRTVQDEVLGSHNLLDDMYKKAKLKFDRNQLDRIYEMDSCEDKPMNGENYD